MRIALKEWETQQVRTDELRAAAECDLETVAHQVGPLAECRPGWSDSLTLTAGGVVGEVSVGQVHLEVHPHLPVGDVFELFAWTEGVQLTLFQDVLGVCGQQSTTLIEALAAGLVCEAERILRGDIDRTWLRREERLLVLRGRPRFEKFGLAPPELGLPCRYVEPTRDTLLNRLVWAGLDVAVRRLSRHAGWLRRARPLAGTFQDLAGPVWPTRADFTFARERLGPRTEHYRAAITLAEWLLLGAGPLSSSGVHGQAGWSLDMASLFEKAVTQALAREVRRVGLELRPQPADRRAITNSANACYRSIRPDVEVLTGGEVIAVIDAKYKRYGLAADSGIPQLRVSNEDLYQLAFYGAAQERQVALVIVAPADPAGPAILDLWRSIRIADQHLWVIPVDMLALARGKAEIWSRACRDGVLSGLREVSDGQRDQHRAVHLG